MGVQFTYQPPAILPIAALLLAKAAAETAGAEALLQLSEPLVPKDTGKLVGSGRVEHNGTSAAVIYDAVAEDGYAYGVRQHEDLTLNHPHGGEAKFLEKPMHSGHAAILAAERVVLAKLL